MNREIKTDLYNILDLLNCAEDYGFADDVFYSSMFNLIKPLTDEEIKAFSETFITKEMREEGYTEEDSENVSETLGELNNKYGK